MTYAQRQSIIQLGEWNAPRASLALTSRYLPYDALSLRIGYAARTVVSREGRACDRRRESTFVRADKKIRQASGLDDTVPLPARLWHG